MEYRDIVFPVMPWSICDDLGGIKTFLEGVHRGQDPRKRSDMEVGEWRKGTWTMWLRGVEQNSLDTAFADYTEYIVGGT